MGINTNQNLPQFLNDTPLTRADIRQLRQAIARLSEDTSSLFRYGGSQNVSDRFTIEIFLATVASAFLDNATPSAQYNMVRAVTTDGLTENSQWTSDDDTMPGQETNFVATNLAELNPDPAKFEKPLSNSIPATRPVIIYGFWNRAGNGNGGSSGGDSDSSSKLYVFDVAPPAPLLCTLETDGGANATTPGGTANYTYTATDYMSGNQIATLLSPLWARPLGVLTGPAANGSYIWKSGVCILVTTDEQPALDACS